MKLAKMTWMQVQKLDCSQVVLIPTGAFEQHGPHMPLSTDALIAEAIANDIESYFTESVLLTPTLWLGASDQHFSFPGTITATLDSYTSSLKAIILSMVNHGFHKFCIINSHGGNNDFNAVTLRSIKHESPELTLCHFGYWELITDLITELQEGLIKRPTHSGEFETSVMMYLHPELIDLSKLTSDGFFTNPPPQGLITHFDEISEDGPVGFANLATKEKGKLFYEAAVKACCKQVKTLIDGFIFF